MILIDPGHGGDAKGCTAMGEVESTLNLQLALALQRLAERGGGPRLIFSRLEDTYRTVAERKVSARGCDGVISIHHDIRPAADSGCLCLHWPGARAEVLEACAVIQRFMPPELGRPRQIRPATE